MNYKHRVQKMFSHADPCIDVILLKNGPEGFIDPTFFYTTGLTQGLFEGCCQLLFPDGQVHLIVTELESTIAKETSATIHHYQSKTEMETILKQFIGEKSRIGLHASRILYQDYEWVSSLFHSDRILDVTDAIQQARMRKDQCELQAIQKACDIADKVMEEVGTYIKQHMTENELAAEIDYHLQRYGAQHPAFTTIASFGPHTALPHYTHDDTTLKRGDFVLCDFGATVDKYHSDITRTFVFGDASEKQKHIHHIVQQAQNKAFDLLKPSIKASEIHNNVLTFINETSYQDCFIHSTGHSLGLMVHDPGISLSGTCDKILQEDMVLTVEPGIYIHGYGGVRIEDDIVVTKEGCRRLTNTSSELIEL